MENKVTQILLFIILIAGGSSTVAESNQKPDPSALTGDYYFGTGFADNQKLRLSKDGTFNFSSASSFVYATVEGTYAVESGIVILSPKTSDLPVKSNSGGETEIKVTRIDDYAGYPTRFLPIKWGGRLYLVAESQIADFCNSVNLGAEPRKEINGAYFLRWGDNTKPTVTRLPEVPQQWRAYLFQKPVKGRVISVEENKFATINVGDSQGLKVGMVVAAKNKGSGWVALKLVQVNERTARAEIQDSLKKLKVGDRVTSKLH